MLSLPIDMPTTKYARRSLQKGFGNRTLCSFLMALSIMALVLASYVLSGGTTDVFHGLLSTLSLTYNHSGTESQSSNPCSAVLPFNISCHMASVDIRIQLTDRRIPQMTELFQYEPHLFSVIPQRYLYVNRSSCWYDKYSGNYSTNPYEKNGYFLYGKRLRSIFVKMQQGFWEHVQVIEGEYYRLRCLPNFFIIGQPKCGTTDLYERLRLHPNIQFSITKEPHWWTRKRFGIISLKEPFQKLYLLEDYLDLFDSAAQKVQDYRKALKLEAGQIDPIIIGEASASTMWDNSPWSYFYGNGTHTEPPVLVQDFIHALNPQAKFIIMLRDPVERLYSDYLYFAIANKSAEDFHDKVNESLQMFDSCLQGSSLRACVYNTTFSKIVPVRLHVGLYVVYLWDWLSVYNLDQFLVLRLEDHAANITQSMRLVYRFLNLALLNDKQEASVTNKKAANSRRRADCSLGPMLLQTRQLLRDFYQPYNQKLAQMLSNSAFLWKT